jgi:methylenetetrahydrofolate reductase (NADPH)
MLCLVASHLLRDDKMSILADLKSPPLAKPPSVSFEFFPPKSDAATENLWQSIQMLAPLKPTFVSVTYGAGGSTRDRTHALVKRIAEQTELEPAAHLTCVGASRDDINRIAESYWDSGIKHIVALRGDMPGGAAYAPHPEGYEYADALVKGLKAIGDFEISVAAYPETHPQARSPEDDIAHLKRKFDAGGDQAITQYFFDNALYDAFLARARAAGITKPILPGILPVGNFAQVAKFSAMCGTSVPEWLRSRYDGVEDEAIIRSLAVATATEQCKLLCTAGADHIHFYTLNRPRLVLAICRMLRIGAQG